MLAASLRAYIWLGIDVCDDPAALPVFSSMLRREILSAVKASELASFGVAGDGSNNG